jgi:hypothetical protein
MMALFYTAGVMKLVQTGLDKPTRLLGHERRTEGEGRKQFRFIGRTIAAVRALYRENKEEEKGGKESNKKKRSRKRRRRKGRTGEEEKKEKEKQKKNRRRGGKEELGAK